MKRSTRGNDRPQLIDVRKPMRPVHVATTRLPIKVTKPMTFGIETQPARRAR